MADETDAEVENDAEESGGGGKKKLIIIGVAALLLLGGGGGAAAYFLGLFGGGDEAETAEAEGDASSEDGEEHADADGSDGDADGDGAGEDGSSGVVFLAMPDVLVNLQSDSKRMRFLKLKVALEAANETVAAELETMTPRIMDSFQMYLRALSIDEVRGSAGMQRLKDELMVRINHAVHPLRVNDLLVREMLVQ